jgi:acyl carrier protein
MKDFKDRFNKLLIDKLGVNQEDIKPNAKFTEDLGADSLDMVELIMEFESEFQITIPDEDAEGISTVGDAETYLVQKMSND